MRKLTLISAAIGSFVLATAFAQAQTVEESDAVEPPGQEGGGAARLPQTPSLDLEQVASSVIEGTNRFRRGHSLDQLSVDPELASAAKYFADFMTRTGKYGHRADDQTPAERASQHGYDDCIILENIAYRHGSAVANEAKLSDVFVQGWKNSPGHRENMLDPDVTETGVAVSRRADKEDAVEYYAVQMFGRPKSGAIRFQITNASGEALQYTVDRRNSQRTFQLPPHLSRTHTQCRPSTLDFGWTPADDSRTVKDGTQLTVRRSGGGFQVSVGKAAED